MFSYHITGNTLSYLMSHSPYYHQKYSYLTSPMNLEGGCVFHPFVCLFVCLSTRYTKEKITQGFQGNFRKRCVLQQGTVVQILRLIKVMGRNHEFLVCLFVHKTCQKVISEFQFSFRRRCAFGQKTIGQILRWI